MERRARRRSYLGLFGVIVTVLVIVAVVLWLLSGGRDLDTEAAPVDDYPYLGLQMFAPDPGGRGHFAVGVTYDAYNSNPPTSGPHTAAVDPGVYDTAVPKESAVHNMEHGQVVVWYNCGGGPEALSAGSCGELVRQLGLIVTDANENGKQVLMTPYSEIEQRIALTAWQFLDAFDAFDAERVRLFIDTFYCHTNLEGFC